MELTGGTDRVVMVQCRRTRIRGPGDSTLISASIYGLGPNDYSDDFRIRVKDVAGNFYVTESFTPCQSKASQR